MLAVPWPRGKQSCILHADKLWESRSLNTASTPWFVCLETLALDVSQVGVRHIECVPPMQGTQIMLSGGSCEGSSLILKQGTDIPVLPLRRGLES